MLLGVARVLVGSRAVLPGRVTLVFQPAEEGPPPGEEGGAALMIKQGLLRDKPDAALALHTLASLPVGQVGITSGPAWAHISNFKVTLHGQGGHGARPQHTVDPITLAARAILALQTVVSREVDPIQPAVLSIGSLHGGNRRNVIPDAVHFSGTVRTFHEASRARIEAGVRRVLEGLTVHPRASYSLSYQESEPALVNDPELAVAVARSLQGAVGVAQVKSLPPSLGGEDFARIAQRVPSVMFRLGVSDPAQPSGPHHSATFRADDAALPVGIRALSQAALDYLRAGEVRQASPKD